jgi:hypothetical protein
MSDLELTCLCVDALVDALIAQVDEILAAHGGPGEKFGGADQVRSTPHPSNTPLGRVTVETPITAAAAVR